MSQMATPLGLIFLLSALAVSPSSADWISGKELQESCDALLSAENDFDGALCRAFVHGYLLGADGPKPTADPGKDASGQREQESFSDRALRTRVSSAAVRRVQGVESTPYCLHDTIELVDVARALADHLNAQPDASGITDAAVVREALIRHFPCDA